MDEHTDFGQAVLRNLESLVPLGTTQADLALELGLCAWMHRCDTELHEAVGRLGDVREAVLVASGLDAATEPVPFVGREPQAALLNLVVYLGTLLSRASAHTGCDTATLVARAGEALASTAPRVRVDLRRIRELRSS